LDSDQTGNTTHKGAEGIENSLLEEAAESWIPLPWWHYGRQWWRFC
jgi:hypothetical protein